MLLETFGIRRRAKCGPSSNAFARNNSHHDFVSKEPLADEVAKASTRVSTVR
jgi:hypothetical protein